MRAQRFELTPDRQLQGAPVGAFPSLDLAVVAFVRAGRDSVEPRAANVLFSREHPQGLVARAAEPFGAIDNLRYDADQRDASGTSVAWQPGADWRALRWQRLGGSTAPDAPRVVAPYPASLIKLVVAVGVAMAVEAGRSSWSEAMPLLAPMITVSDNDATDACVALLHRTGHVERLHERLHRDWGLPTLQLNRTTPRGGWRNGDGAGVGQLHMTAWDTVRLLWLLDADAPPAPWLAADVPRLGAESLRRLRALLAAQQLDEILSSGALRAVPGWVPGLPDAPTFAHKTGTTENYASDAGIVRGDGVHYLVAVLSNLGSRYAAPDAPGHDRCATTWRLPALGAAVHALVKSLA